METGGKEALMTWLRSHDQVQYLLNLLTTFKFFAHSDFLHTCGNFKNMKSF